MSVQIRPADLVKDRTMLISLFRRHLTSESNEKRFAWLYSGGPHGTARAWVLCDGINDHVVGAAAAFPRRLSANSREICGWVLGDFCLDEHYRSLGPALQLQKACMSAVDTPSFEFVYDFPSHSMMAIYKRLGVAQPEKLVRWAKPLQVKSKIQKMVGSKTLTRVLGTVASVILRHRGWTGETSACELVPHEGLCKDEFTALDQRIRTAPGIFTVRSAAYLNWRFLSHPTTTYEILTARRSGRLTGYVVYTKDVEEASIADLCCVEEPAVIARLLSGAVDRLGRAGAATISLNAGESHPWQATFHRAGFRPRESSPVVIYTRPRGALTAADFREKWYLMRGERDS
jgi:hypothetical protein